jgi:hypothetical protein
MRSVLSSAPAAKLPRYKGSKIPKKSHSQDKAWHQQVMHSRPNVIETFLLGSGTIKGLDAMMDGECWSPTHTLVGDFTQNQRRRHEASFADRWQLALMDNDLYDV